MSPGILGLALAIGPVVLVIVGALVWSWIDNRWLYRGPIPPNGEGSGWKAPEPFDDTNWWMGSGNG